MNTGVLADVSGPSRNISRLLVFKLGADGVLSTKQADSETCDNLGMQNTNIYAGYRYPPQIISHAVWLYHRLTLSL